jgi:hypothetical protein
MILKALLTAKVLTKNEVRALINEIEDKDKVIIENKVRKVEAHVKVNK